MARHARRFASTALAAVCMSGMLAACGLNATKPDQQLFHESAPQWYAKAPDANTDTTTAVPAETSNSRLAELSHWWTSWNDPTLSALQTYAQQHSHTLAQATARITQARADASAAGAALWPSLNLTASVTNGRNPQLLQSTKQTTSIAGLDARWEIDLFGAVSIARSGILARLNARELEWHDARISLAAEVANTYINLRHCEAQTGLQQATLQSQRLALELIAQKAAAGFVSPLDLAQQRAVLASAQTQWQQQTSDCTIVLKALVVLTAMPEPELRDLLTRSHGQWYGQLPQVRSFTVAAIPANVLLKRPDLRAALETLIASASEIGVAEAKRYPSISLLGSINVFGVRVAGQTVRDNSWSFGPSLDLPLFDAGKRKAAVDSASARYAENLSGFRQQSLVAVKEVEEALVRLESANQLLLHYQAIDTARTQALQSAEAGLRAGSISTLEKEDALRQQLASQQQKLQLQRDQASAWIALYKAVGGDWSEAAGSPDSPIASNVQK
ncbi:efflux transporter outer membrane subunit [Undibacterium sp. RuTC16W]|uniref:efflux transporter outer membrane subunit n=1 Tax=Undibacterium sp. RuTC16W TaxID=3413048 RepID=UPI003BF11CD6